MFVMAGGRRDRILFRNPSGLILKPEAVPADVTEIWYADCCPPDLADPACGRQFLVFDHHISNAQKFGDDPRCTFDMHRSGTSLMAHVLGLMPTEEDLTTAFRKYDSFSPLVEALEAYDLGRFDNEAGQRLADIAASYSQEELLDLMIERDPEGILYDRDLTARAEALSSVRELYAESALRSCRRIQDFRAPGWPEEHPAVTAAVAVAPVYWKNAVAEKLLETVDVAIIIDVVGGMVSFRSRDVDVSTMATAMGGGGHMRASGFKANSWDMLRALMNEVFG